MTRIRALICFLAVALTSCGATNPETVHSADQGAEVTLAPGAATAFKPAGIVIQFVGVTVDSRCPRDTTCMWAGEVKVLVSVRNSRQSPTRHEILEGEHADGSNYSIAVVRVQPLPVASAKIPADQYRATLKLQKL